MKINVGSKNQTKVNAVVQAIDLFASVRGAEVEGIEANNEVYGQPKSLQDIIEGAMGRALHVFKNCDLSVGIESGLMEVPKTKTGYMQVAACVIYDGNKYHLGLSPAFEWPQIITDAIHNQGLDISQALKASGLTDHEKLGTTNGGIHLLTKGAVSRTDENRQAVMMALVQLENPDLY